MKICFLIVLGFLLVSSSVSGLGIIQDYLVNGTLYFNESEVSSGVVKTLGVRVPNNEDSVFNGLFSVVPSEVVESVEGVGDFSIEPGGKKSLLFRVRIPENSSERFWTVVYKVGRALPEGDGLVNFGVEVSGSFKVALVKQEEEVFLVEKESFLDWLGVLIMGLMVCSAVIGYFWFFKKKEGDYNS